MLEKRQQKHPGQRRLCEHRDTFTGAVNTPSSFKPLLMPQGPLSKAHHTQPASTMGKLGLRGSSPKVRGEEHDPYPTDGADGGTGKGVREGEKPRADRPAARASMLKAAASCRNVP